MNQDTILYTESENNHNGFDGKTFGFCSVQSINNRENTMETKIDYRKPTTASAVSSFYLNIRLTGDNSE